MDEHGEVSRNRRIHSGFWKEGQWVPKVTHWMPCPKCEGLMMNKYTLPVDYRNLHWTERKEVRLQYIEEQDNKCYYCKNLLTDTPTVEAVKHEINWKLFPEGFLNYPVHLHHNHDDGMTIGAVHSFCNAVLWQYEGE